MPFDKNMFVKPEQFIVGSKAYKPENYKKNEILREYAQEVSPKEFYRDVFIHKFEPQGIDTSITTGIGNMMCTCLHDDGKMHTDIITEDTRDFINEKYESNLCALIPLVSFYGRTAKAVNARFIFGIAIDIDYVDVKCLGNIINQYLNDIIPVPTYIVNSGTGVHLYYLWNEPLPAYPMNRKAVSDFKKALTKIVWNGYTSTIAPQVWDHDKKRYKDIRQYQGCVQGYRVVGSLSKLGAGYPVTAFKVGHKYDCEDLNKWLLDSDKQYALYRENRYKSELSLKEAEEKYPDWYERRIVRKEKIKKWHKSTKLYEWFFNRITKECRFGHRYHCICMLAVFGVKCDIPKEKVLEDAMSLFSLLNDLNPEMPFEKEEIEKAVKGFYKEELNTLPINSIKHLSGIDIQKNKRNGREQNKHLFIARQIKAAKRALGEFKDGRPKDSGTKEFIVKEWRQANPNGNKLQCAKETGLSRTTVIKWW